jgi:hypothetical protein
MDKLQYRAIQQAWKLFDASTALGCSQKQKEFDAIYCAAAWDHYNDVLTHYDIQRFPPLKLYYNAR